MEMELIASESAARRKNVDYLYKTLCGPVDMAGGKATVSDDGTRCVFKASVPDGSFDFIRRGLEDKIADIIAVNYKYEYFLRHVKPAGLKDIEYDILLSALIAADIEEDKRYVTKMLACPYAIDGSFVFTMKPLKKKWSEIAGYVPNYFCYEQLKDFVSYIVDEKKNRRVYVAGNGVFDGRYNKLIRADLAGGGEINVVKEIILSSSGEVELDCKLSEKEEFYLKDFFGDKIFFRKGYFS